MNIHMVISDPRRKASAGQEGTNNRLCVSLAFVFTRQLQDADCPPERGQVSGCIGAVIAGPLSYTRAAFFWENRLPHRLGPASDATTQLRRLLVSPKILNQLPSSVRGGLGKRPSRSPSSITIASRNGSVITVDSFVAISFPLHVSTSSPASQRSLVQASKTPRI